MVQKISRMVRSCLSGPKISDFLIFPFFVSLLFLLVLSLSFFYFYLFVLFYNFFIIFFLGGLHTNIGEYHLRKNM